MASGNWMRRVSIDPAIEYERKESRSCKGCIHQSHLWGAAVCTKLDKLAEKKCGRYQEAKQ